MELTGAHRVPAPRERVFAALSDPALLVRCIPVLETMERHSVAHYAARVRISLGPLKARFDGTVMVEPVAPPGLYRLHGEGAGLFGGAKGIVELRLDEADAGTVLTYRLSAGVGGRIGQLAARAVQAKAEAHIARFFERFTEEMLRPAP